MTQVKKGDTVRVHYTGRLEDGTEFDSSRDRDPLEFEIGAERVIPGFERMVIGMTPGETKTATVAAEEAYGVHDPEKVLEADREQLPPDLSVEVGQIVELRSPSGQTLPAVIAGVTEETVSIDMNHPLAGKNLVFEVELLEIL